MSNLELDYAKYIIKHYEGFESRPYQDVSNNWSVGYGFTRVDGKPVSATYPKPLTVSQADYILNDILVDLRKEILDLTKNDNWVTAPRMGAVLSFVYNVGIGHFCSSQMNGMLERNSPDMVASKITCYVWSGRKVLQGLADRRLTEKLLLTVGDVEFFHYGKRVDNPNDITPLGTSHKPTHSPSVRRGVTGE